MTDPAAIWPSRCRLARGARRWSPYAVAFVALVHPVFRTVVYASAGHDVAFRQADDGGLHHIAPTAPMLGIPLAINPCDAVFTLDPTETFVIATDGVTESRRAGSYRFFGAEGAACTVARSLQHGRNPARAVLEAACAHAGGYQHDDVGVVVVRVMVQLRGLVVTASVPPIRGITRATRQGLISSAAPSALETPYELGALQIKCYSDVPS